ncbi:hypothetical protein [Propionibacterium freudenreichii]|uniref:hypothetical protein n=1 Tax=Propionibacterium freudenreichii TaxID=1744 RepID=UPI000541D9F0|nr:hypothetical protein [Propionibacterium freudenreichii]CEG94922.1 Protein of unknown function [Propionibacterium freudenreichii]
MDGFDLLLVADRLKAALTERGFTHPRVAGLVASGGTLPPGVALEVYVVPPALPEPLTASDLGRIGRELEAVVGWPVLLWAVMPGEEDFLPGERVTYL